MRLEHSFTLPLGVDDAWDVLLDVDRLMACVPGATVDKISDDEVSGAIKVKLGYIQPTYRGTLRFVQRDREARRIVIRAQADTRTYGSGTAGVVVTLTGSGDTTTVSILSDLSLSGKPGQLEEQVVADAGTRLVRQFAQRLTERLQLAPAAAGPDAKGPSMADETGDAPAQTLPAPTDAPEPAEQPVESVPESPAPATTDADATLASDQSADEESGEPAAQPGGDEPAPARPPEERPSPAPQGPEPDDTSPPQVIPDRASEPGRSGTGRHASAPDTSARTIPPAAVALSIVVVLLLLRRRRRARRSRRS